MRNRKTPTRFAALPALLCAPLLTACGDDRPAIGLPPIERTAPVAWPVVPAGDAVCDDAETGALVPCLSDLQAAELMAALGDALDAANGKLLWLGDWMAEFEAAQADR